MRLLKTFISLFLCALPCSIMVDAQSSQENTEDTIHKNPSDTIKIRDRQAITKTGSSRCVAITQDGTQCSRPAKKGSAYCWQHSPKKGSNYKDSKESSKRGKSASRPTGKKKSSTTKRAKRR